MAVAQGSHALASDYTEARTQVLALLTKEGRSATIQEIAAGRVMYASEMNTLLSAYTTGLNNWTAGNSTNYGANNGSEKASYNGQYGNVAKSSNYSSHNTLNSTVKNNSAGITTQ